MNKITVYFIFVLFGWILFFLILLRHKILSKLFPDKYVRIVIITRINTVIEKLVPIKLGQKIIDENNNEYVLANENLYLKKRIRTYFFNEGEKLSLDFRTRMLRKNAELERSIEETKISGMFDERFEGIAGFFNQYGIIIIIVVLIIVVVIILRQPAQTTIVNPVTSGGI